MNPTCLKGGQMPRFAFMVLFVMLASTASAQVVVQTEDGDVQIAGLLRRTPAELEQAIQEKRPGTNLSSGACAGVLKYELGFPDAAVMHYRMEVSANLPDSMKAPPITLLLVVEPEDAERVRYAPSPPDSLGPVAEWVDQYERYPDGRLLPSIQMHVGRPDGRPVTLPEGIPDTMKVLAEKGVAFLEAHDSDADRARALEVIRTDRDWIDRSIAAAILTNFPEEDSTWWALTEVIRGIGPYDYGRAEGIGALQSLGNVAARRVDWAPAAESLRAILDGTNLFAIDPLMGVLARTEISPELADEILGDGRYVLAYLRSPNPIVRSNAYRFLRQISGLDFGHDADRWAEWIESVS